MVDKERVSSIKPQVQQKPYPDIVWNDKDIQTYKDIGLVAPDDVCKWELKFLNDVDVRKGPIERTVTRIIRLKAIDWSTTKHERKEYIYYEEDWEGKDWRGIPLNPVRAHIEGYYTKRYLRPHLNKQTGEVDYNEIDPTSRGRQLDYTIPWSKKAVDDIIAKSIHTDKDSIGYVIKFGREDCPWGPRMPTRSEFSYDQFATWKWEDVYKWHTKPHIEAAEEYAEGHLDKNKTSYRLSHEPA